MKATEAKRLLEPIPKEYFIIKEFTDGISKCCTIGHLVRLSSEDIEDYSFANCADIEPCKIRDKSMYFLKDDKSIAEVNNGDQPKYQQDSPKDRVISLLDDMIKAGY